MTEPWAHQRPARASDPGPPRRGLLAWVQDRLAAAAQAAAGTIQEIRQR